MSDDDVMRGRALERADVMVWLISMAEVMRSSSKAAAALCEVNGTDAKALEDWFANAAEFVLQGHHAGACERFGHDLGLVFDSGVVDAAGLADMLLERMGR